VVFISFIFVLSVVTLPMLPSSHLLSAGGPVALLFAVVTATLSSSNNRTDPQSLSSIAFTLCAIYVVMFSLVWCVLLVCSGLN